MITPRTEGSVTVSERDGVATVLIDRADKLNALTPELLDALYDAVRVLSRSDARVVLLRTGGQRAFCVGADINRFAELSPAAMWSQWTARGHEVFSAIASLPQPTVAVLQGDAFGGGFELALAADFRVASDSVRVGLPEVGLGTVPGWAGTERLTALVGPAHSREVVLARRLIDARTAHQWGALTDVVDATGLETAVAHLVEQLAGGAPIAVRLAKQLLRAATDGVPSSYIEPLAGALSATSHDLAEGVAAFRERRPATFTGT